MIIRYADGSYAHGVIYRLIGGTLRAVVVGVEDAIEFQLIRGAWTSENGATVTFEFPFETEVEFFQIMPTMSVIQKEAHCAAGGDCMLRRLSDSSGGEPLN